ncbi:MAG: DUF2029 domain-containing protein [Myxococcales bacterium]|nr:DUF2029 domain-containing protein [Myxococcales bacterium]
MSSRGALAVCLAALGAGLSLTVVPGVYTLDENNYLASLVGLRHGGFGLPGTAELPPSHELYWFDPLPRARGTAVVPVSSAVPPLYAPVALPFSLLGWRGLVGLNTLCFLAATIAVFALARRHATAPHTPWLAAGAFALGAFNLDYAQGVWPHMLAVALAAWAFYFGSRARDSSSVIEAALAGALAGLSTGVRYQNLVFAALLGAGLALLARRRLRTSLAFAASLGLLVLALSGLNRARLGTWNPIAKGQSYAELSALGSIAQPSSGGGRALALLEPLHVLWAKVVDFTAHPPIVGEPQGPVPEGQKAHWGWEPDALGAFGRHGAVKKAWLQSCPWVLISLLALGWAWHPRARLKDGPRRELRASSFVVAGMLGLFAAAGFARWDGLCFNQRYFLELMPLVACAAALAVERFRLPTGALLRGLALGAVLALPVLFAEPGSFMRTTLLMKAPLALALAGAATWVLSLRGRLGGSAAITVLGAGLSWALVVHLGDDLPATRRLRSYNLVQTSLLAEALPPRAALLAFGPSKDPAGPLLLERDLVIADPRVDGGETAPALIRAMLEARRPVYLDMARFPPGLAAKLGEGLSVTVAVPGRDPILRLAAQ